MAKQYSYNGWLASKNSADFGGLAQLVIAGESFAPGVRAGDVYTVLQYVAHNMHMRVEPVIAEGWHQADDWGFAYRTNRNAKNLSCHASGTAIDYNATRHPNGAKGTFSKSQVAEIHQILDELDGVVRWGGDFSGTTDEMHFEINASAARVAAVARKIREGSGTSSVLRVGDSGAAVRTLQVFLNTVFPSYSKLTADGDFGPATEAVVKEFQQRSALDPDGVVGPATVAALRRFGWK